jgi:hypothetical protein
LLLMMKLLLLLLLAGCDCHLQRGAGLLACPVCECSAGAHLQACRGHWVACIDKSKVHGGTKTEKCVLIWCHSTRNNIDRWPAAAAAAAAAAALLLSQASSNTRFHARISRTIAFWLLLLTFLM